MLLDPNLTFMKLTPVRKNNLSKYLKANPLLRYNLGLLCTVKIFFNFEPMGQFLENCAQILRLAPNFLTAFLQLVKKLSARKCQMV